ncbi:MAG: hypothetical protein QNJ18_03820 [Xenococcaceae cyanobacterium MO_167.B52]|nr:hypothetical protein [Xenococcaceae cyanobacterium MO_167.B52]
MSTQRLTQLLHLNHKHLSQLTSLALVDVGSLLIGLVSLIFGLGSTDIQENNFIISTEAELWKPVGEVID